MFVPFLRKEIDTNTNKEKNYLAVLKNSSVYSRIPSFNKVSASGVNALVSRIIWP
jgi:hypothetical protein